ncbi:MAG: hypothetical protein ABL894_00240, partial [Hyphomicrobium sp.]
FIREHEFYYVLITSSFNLYFSYYIFVVLYLPLLASEICGLPWQSNCRCFSDRNIYRIHPTDAARSVPTVRSRRHFARHDVISSGQK